MTYSKLENVGPTSLSWYPMSILVIHKRKHFPSFYSRLRIQSFRKNGCCMAVTEYENTANPGGL